MKKVITFLLWAIIFGLVFNFSTDPTDASFWTRSGLNYYKDYGTGCEYIAGGGFFGKTVLEPRLDKDGNHLCGSGK